MRNPSTHLRLDCIMGRTHNMGRQLVAWLLLAVVVAMATADAVDVSPEFPAKDKQKFAFACENSYIHIKCKEPGEKIRILLANYGRFSIVVCNQDAVSTGWDLKCSSQKSMDIVSERCDGRPHCTFNATNSLFGDPCPSTKKYMEIHYQCVKGKDIITERPVTTTTTITSTTESAPAENVTAAKTTILPSTPQTSTSTSTVVTEKVTRKPEPQKVERFCDAIDMDGIYWPTTTAGTLVHKECPANMMGEARWQCGRSGKWIKYPDLSDCVSTWMADIQDLVEKDAPVEDTVERLNKQLRGHQLISGDLKVATDSVIPGLIERMRTQIKADMSPNTKREKVQSFNKEIVKTGSSLLSRNQTNSWGRLEPKEQKKSATSLIVSLEKMALEVASTLQYETLSSKEENIVMEVSVIKMSTEMMQYNLPLPSLHHKGPDMGLHNFSLPLDGLPGITQSDDITVTYLFYNNLEELMNPASSLYSHSPSRTIGSNIMSASVQRRDQHATNPHVRMGLQRPMNFTLAHKHRPQDKVPVCAYWKYNYSTLIGEWATDGCHVVESTNDHTTCQCNHLTNFAILMDASGTELHQYHQMSLQAITYVGCSVSILCLLMCFISFSIFRNLQSDRNTIHKNLVLCLMLAELLFLFGVGQTQDAIVCKVIAMFLHFLFLACFSWMCLEGAQLYFMLIEVFEAERSRVRWFYLFGYGVPAVIVGVSAAVFHQGYGTENHCWLTTERLFILSFIVPVAVVLCINVVMLSIAMYMMCRHAGVTASAIQSRKKGTLEKMGKEDRNGKNCSYYSDTSSKSMIDMPTWLKGSAVLVVLLGLTWMFGFMYVSAETVVMAYLFTILNSLQGLFIFIFHCFMDRKVKKEWRKAVYKATWLPVCCRVNLGGYHGNFSSPTPTSSSGPQNYFLKFWSGRKRKRSNASLSTTKRRSEFDSFLRSDTSSGCTVGTGLNRYSNQSDKLLPNGGNPYSALPTHYEGGVVGDLSVVDCSVIDSEMVTEYCQKGMQVSNEKRRYSSGSEDDADIKDTISHTSVNKNRLSYLSNDSALKQPSEFTSDSEDAEHQNIDYAVLDDSNNKQTGNRDMSDIDRNVVNDILNMYENTRDQKVKNDRVSSSQERINSVQVPMVETGSKTKSTPNIKIQTDCEAYSNPILESSTHPLLGSVPDVCAEEEATKPTSHS